MVETFWLRYNAVAKSLLSLCVLGAGMTGQLVWALTSDFLPKGIASSLGALGSLFVIPALLALVLGIAGLPTSWPGLIGSMIDIFKYRGLLGTIWGITGQAYKSIVFLPFECPALLGWLPKDIQWLLFREPESLFEPPAHQKENALVKNEYWIFMNGICTTSQIARANQDELYKMFSRPIHVCHNPTDGALVDTIECAVGKVGFFKWWVPKPRNVLAAALRTALNDRRKYTRVVLICHSQGTIITSNALPLVSAQDTRMKDLMKKNLEVYAFANCSHHMSDLNLKYLENLSNGCDTVAWLGALFPYKSFWKDTHGRGIKIDGTFVTEPSSWGHLMNGHYLRPMKNENKFKGSRLQAFRNGRVPPKDGVKPIMQ